jgi:hypothetical protein
LLEGEGDKEDWPKSLGDADGKLEGMVKGSDHGLKEVKINSQQLWQLLAVQQWQPPSRLQPQLQK